MIRNHVQVHHGGRPSTRLFAVGTLSLMMALILGLFWHPATLRGESRTFGAVALHNTPGCPAGYTLVKFESPSGTQTQGPITLVVTRTHEGEPLAVSFTASGGTLVYVVYVKGGPGYRTYDYRPGGVTSGSGLVAPNRNAHKTYGISHVSFCYNEPVSATDTAVPPTDTAVSPTDTAVPPTDTNVPPTDVPPTDVPPTDVPPTDVPPTDVPPTQVARTNTAGPTSSPAPECVPNPEQDLVGRLITPNLGKIMNSSTECSYQVGIASYRKFDENVDNQEIFDWETKMLGPGETVYLEVRTPDCAAQIDLFYGPVLMSLDGQRYGTRLLDSWHIGGGNYCEPVSRTPSIEPTSTSVVPTTTEMARTPTDTVGVPSETPLATNTEVAGTEVVRTRTPTVPIVTPNKTEHPVPNCPDGYLQIKFESPSGTQTIGPITLTVTRYEDGEPMEVSFTVADGTVVYIVYVKGGPGYRTYDYRPDGVTSGSGLVAPHRTETRTYAISHVTFCYLPQATPTVTVATSTVVSPTEIVRTPTDTATATPTATRTNTATATPTATRTSTATATVTGTPPTATNTATSTSTATPSDTATRTATASPTSTATATVTGTPQTATSTVTGTPPTATRTRTRTRTASAIPTITAVEATVVIRTPTPTTSEATTTLVPTTTEVAGTVVIRTPTGTITGGGGGGEASPTGVVLPEVGARTPTSVVLPEVGNRPSTMPVTATAQPLLMLKTLICLALSLMGFGLYLRGFALRESHR